MQEHEFVNGIELGGFINVDRFFMKGLQGAGFGNIVGGYVDGVQAAGFYNIAGGNYGLYTSRLHWMVRVVKRNLLSYSFQDTSWCDERLVFQ